VDLLSAQGKSGEAGPLIESKSEGILSQAVDDKQRLGWSLSLANLHTRVGNHVDAERWCRRVYEQDPAQYAALANSLARQGKLDEALDVCQQAAAKDATAQSAIVMAAMLLESTPKPAHFQRVEPVIAAALKKFDSDPDLLFAVSVLRILQERFGDATGLLNRLLQLRPDDVRALNNLAMCLAEDPQQLAGARAAIDKAIGLAGVDAGLLDTKGTILVYERQPQEAIPLLERARNLDVDPRFRFHLALAYRDAGEVDKAKAELRAVQGRLEAQILTPTDRRMLAGIKDLVAPEIKQQAAP